MIPLSEGELDALRETLDDEYHAWTTYDQVIADFGEVPPFSHIREAEARHIDALRSLFARYGIPVPENPWPGRAPHYSTLQEACAAGVAAEIANAALYDRLLAATRRPDILAVFRNLQEASQQRHHARRSATRARTWTRRRGDIPWSATYQPWVRSHPPSSTA